MVVNYHSVCMYSEGLLGETVTVVNTQGVHPYSERLLGENGTFSQVFYPYIEVLPVDSGE